MRDEGLGSKLLKGGYVGESIESCRSSVVIMLFPQALRIRPSLGPNPK